MSPLLLKGIKSAAISIGGAALGAFVVHVSGLEWGVWGPVVGSAGAFLAAQIKNLTEAYVAKL